MSARPTGTARWLGLAGWVALSFLASVPGRLVAASAEYPALEQPSWAPPGSVFGPVWAALYVLMGVAAWLVWQEGSWRARRGALGLFLVQLALNALWTPLFFGANLRGWAFAEVVLLWVFILATLVAFRRVRPLAGALLAPYLLWVTYAAALNLSIWRLNV